MILSLSHFFCSLRRIILMSGHSLSRRRAGVRGLSHSRYSPNGSSCYLCSRSKYSSLWPLFLSSDSVPICQFRSTSSPKPTDLGGKCRGPSLWTLGTLKVISVVRRPPRVAPTIGASMLKPCKCNQQSCPHSHFMAIVIIYGLYMQKSCPERVEMGDLLGEEVGVGLGR